MKSLQEYINESFSNEMLAELTKLVKRIKKLKREKFEDATIDPHNDDEIHPKLAKIIDKYDEYVEDVMWEIVNSNDNADRIARSIARQAEDNEYRKGTEAHMIILFLEELCDFLKV